MPTAAPRLVSKPKYVWDKPLESAFKQNDIGLYLSDTCNRLIRTNRAFARMLGYSEAQILKKGLPQLIHPDDARSHAASQHSLLTDQTSLITFNIRYAHRAGQVLWGAVTSRVIRCEGDKAPFFLNYVQDISNTALVASETRYRRLFEAAHDGILIVDGDTGRIADVNPFLEHLLGFSRGYFLQRHLWEIGLFKDIETCKAVFLQLKQNRSMRYEHLPLFHQSGAPIEVELVSNLYDVNGQMLVQCNIRDISEQKRASDALRESEERFRATFDKASIGIAHTGIDHQLLRINQEYCAILGYSSDELMRRGLQAITHPDDLAAEFAFSQRALSGALSSYSMDKRYWRRDGVLIWVSVTNTLIYDAEARPSYFISIVQDTSAVQDITARKRLEEELLQSRKMDAIGRLAGGVAHDFNNLLTVITGYCGRVLQRTDDQDTLRQEIGEISMAADRAAALTAKLLAFSRRQVIQRKVTNLNTVLVEMKDLLQRLIREDIGVITTVEPGLGLVEADEGQIGQVVMNLAVNARDAMPTGGTLSLSLRNEFLNDEYALNHLGVCSGRYVALSVRDTGCGMDAETQAQMFDPFFTTKELGKGTGLGLSTVYGIVKEHGGHLAVESAPGEGTTITVYLPRVENAVPQRDEAASVRSDLRGTETILVVEDDSQLRHLTAEILRGEGYTVLEAENGERALEFVARRQEPIHLMLTDIVMPVMGGRELARQVLSSSKCGAVLYMSGYARDATAQDALPTDAPLLSKPFTPERLLETVRSTLDNGRTALGANDRLKGSLAPKTTLSP